MKRSYNVYIAGATGFVGKNLIDYLTNLPDPPDITCLVRASSDTSFLAKYPVSIERVDFSDKSSLHESFQKADYVYNLVGMTAAPTEEKLQQANRDISANLLAAYLANKESIKGYFYMSTLAVAGPRDYGYHDPARTDQLYPLTAYGRTKLEGEKLHWPYIFDDNLNISILRAPGIYGRWDTDIRQYFDIVTKGIAPVLGTGETKVTLINICDLVRFMHKITIDRENRGIFYVYDDRIYTMKDLGKIAKQILRPGALHIKIPPVLVRSAASLNQMLNANATFNREKCKEMLAEDWGYEPNDFYRSGDSIQFDLEQGIYHLYFSESM